MGLSRFQKLSLLMLLLISIAPRVYAQVYAQATLAPLYLSINGPGTVSPYQNGDLLEVGQTYTMVATPNPGAVFTGWQPANVFTFTIITVNPDGTTNAPVVSTVISPIPAYTNQSPSLEFTVQPVTVISDVPGVLMITEASGWRANFVALTPLNIQLSDSAVVLSWTNPAYTLQSAPAPTGDYTNISGATSPFTNTIAGPAQYFRLVSP